MATPWSKSLWVSIASSSCGVLEEWINTKPPANALIVYRLLQMDFGMEPSSQTAVEYSKVRKKISIGPSLRRLILEVPMARELF